jgi:hypothetical protein
VPQSADPSATSQTPERPAVEGVGMAGVGSGVELE